MSFPHISECIDLAGTLKSDTYGYIVGEQPIGAALFRKFCEVSSIFSVVSLKIFGSGAVKGAMLLGKTCNIRLFRVFTGTFESLKIGFCQCANITC